MPEGGRLISAVAAVARALTQAPSWIDAAPEVLRLIGEATDAGYVCAYENVLDRRGASDNFAIPSRILLPRRLMVGAKFTF